MNSYLMFAGGGSSSGPVVPQTTPAPVAIDFMAAGGGTLVPATYQHAHVDTVSGDIPVVLGTPGATDPNTLTVKNVGTVNDVVVTAAFGLIDGAASATVPPLNSFTFVFTGAGWDIV